MNLFDRLFGIDGKSRREFHRELDAAEATIRAMPLEAARERLERLLSDPLKYRVTLSTRDGDSVLIAELGPTLRAFFSRYEAVQEVHGEAHVARSLIGGSAYDAALVRIGTDLEFTEIVVRPGSDEVFDIDGVRGRPETGEPFPSVYHYLLASAAVIYPDRR